MDSLTPAGSGRSGGIATRIQVRYSRSNEWYPTEGAVALVNAKKFKMTKICKRVNVVVVGVVVVVVVVDCESLQYSKIRFIHKNLKAAKMVQTIACLVGCTVQYERLV